VEVGVRERKREKRSGICFRSFPSSCFSSFVFRRALALEFVFLTSLVSVIYLYNLIIHKAFEVQKAPPRTVPPLLYSLANVLPFPSPR